MMTENTRKLIERIKALQAMRVEAGATEAEAATAASIAARLMAEHAIDAEAMAAASFDKDYLPIKGIGLHPKKSHPCVYAAGGIQHLTGCQVYTSDRGLLAIGDEVGRTMATYLFDMVRNVIDAAWKRERARRLSTLNECWFGLNLTDLARTDGLRKAVRGAGLDTGRIAQRSFGLGMASRISDRMLTMPPARPVPAAAAARILSGLEVKNRAPTKSTYDHSALAAGGSAGDSVPISLGVGARGGEMARIGSSGGQ